MEQSETLGQSETNYFLMIISLGQQLQNSCTLVSILYISNSRVLRMVGLKFRDVNRQR